MYVYVCMEYHQSYIRIYIYGFIGGLYELLTFTTYSATFLDTGDVFSPRTSFRHSKVCKHISKFWLQDFDHLDHLFYSVLSLQQVKTA